MTLLDSLHGDPRQQLSNTIPNLCSIPPNIRWLLATVIFRVKKINKYIKWLFCFTPCKWSTNLPDNFTPHVRRITVFLFCQTFYNISLGLLCFIRSWSCSSVLFLMYLVCTEYISGVLSMFLYSWIYSITLHFDNA